MLLVFGIFLLMAFFVLFSYAKKFGLWWLAVLAVVVGLAGLALLIDR